jgi:sugar phosphate isomerase/epimerase
MSVVPGLVSVTFRALSAASVVELAGAHGMRAIEWGGDVHVPVGAHGVAREVAARCADAGIAVAAYGSYYRASGSFEPVLETAVSLGAPRIRVWAGEVGSASASLPAVAADLRRVARLAADAGVEIAVEYHANTVTDTLSSALTLFAEVPELRPYWQPPIGVSSAEAREAVAALLPRLVTAHVFSWSPTGERLPLAAGAYLWRPILATLAAEPGDRYALLEFVRDDSPAAFAEDAATLLGWLSAAVPLSRTPPSG